MNGPKYYFMYNFMILMSLLTCSFAHAGAESGGGGGNAVVCFDTASIAQQIRTEAGGELRDEYISHVNFVEIYDLFEARLPRGLSDSRFTPQIRDLRATDTILDYVDRTERMLDFSVPALSRVLHDSRARLQPHNIIFEPHGLAPIDDANAVGMIDTQNCVLATMGAHRLADQSSILHVDVRLFNHTAHSMLSKAVFYLHEYFYMAARRSGQTDSRNTRSLVSLLIIANSGLMVKDLYATAVQLQFLTGEESPRLYIDQVQQELVDHLSQQIYEFFHGNDSIWAARRLSLISEVNTTLMPSGAFCGSNVMICRLLLQDLINRNEFSVSVLQPHIDALNAFARDRLPSLRESIISAAAEAPLSATLRQAPLELSFVDSFVTQHIPDVLHMLERFYSDLAEDDVVIGIPHTENHIHAGAATREDEPVSRTIRRIIHSNVTERFALPPDVDYSFASLEARL